MPAGMLKSRKRPPRKDIMAISPDHSFSPGEDGCCNCHCSLVFFLRDWFGDTWIAGNNRKAGQTTRFSNGIWNGYAVLVDKGKQSREIVDIWEMDGQME